MVQRRNEILFGIFLAITILIFIGASFFYSPKARLVPLVIGFFSLVLVLYQIFTDLAARKSRVGDEELLSQSKVLSGFSFAAGCGILVLLCGFFGSMGIILMGLTRFWFRESWLASITITASLLIFSYLLFTMIFAIDLYPGAIPSFVISLLPE